MTARLADAIAALEAAYPPALAQGWDAVGLVCGDPADKVSSVLVAVDPVVETVDEALDVGAQLLVTHHPLLLRGVHGVGADTPKGALVHRLVREGTALFTAHTNADAADPGVSDALAAALGLAVDGPLEPVADAPLDKIITFVPVGPAITAVHEALLAAAGPVADRGHRSFATAGTGQVTQAGEAGKLERVAETRLEVVLPRGRRAAVVAALRAAHPSDQPAFDVIEFADLPSPRGLGRIGSLPATEPLHAFADRVAAALPATTWGVRAAGDPDRPVRRVAVCGGAGDSALGAAAAARVDAYVTADLRHHPASESLLAGGPALVDVAHWASEWPWCAQAADVLRSALGGNVEVRVSTRRTDPWTVGRAQPIGRTT